MTKIARINLAEARPNLGTVEERQPDIKNPAQQRHDVLSVYATVVNNFNLFFKSMIKAGFDPERLLTADHNRMSSVAGLNNYQTESLVFNTRYQFHPFAIALCQSTKDVVQVYKTALQYNLPVRVRSGGHDHAGESNGDNAILIDVTGIKPKVSIDDDHVASIGAGYRFYELTPILADNGRMIPHGTCATVGLSGFIQGGGWGPWTRKHGMCCEHLVAATVVLGDGSVIEATETDHSDILWALRGGGGMSYGIVTEWKVKTFELPDEIHRFTIEWNQPKVDGTLCQEYTTISILEVWERVINAEDTPALLGTNLKINAMHVDGNVNQQNIDNIHHHTLMYGYWEGTEKALEDFIADKFHCVGGLGATVVIFPANGKAQPPSQKYPADLMGDWGRNSLADISKRVGLGTGKTALLEGTPFTPDYDAPAPHKISSKLVSSHAYGQWVRQSRRQLIQTLSSPLLSSDNEHLGLFSYVTLGAIVGDFYQKMGVTQENACVGPQKDKDGKLTGVAFPYRPCQYTIQYQTWWNELIKQKVELQNNSVYVDTNRAMDWIDVSQKTQINGAYGAFISFKDPSIATPVYFQENYETLRDIKLKYSKDTFNHLRTRKTII